MTKPLSRPIPTPGDLAIAHRPPAAATRQVVTARPVDAPPYDRHAWEQALYASELHPHDKLVAALLAHHAGPAGHLRPGGPQRPEQLARTAGVSANGARMALAALERDGYLTRPDIHSWTRRQVWPITLTLPPAKSRTEPPSAEDPS